MRFVTLLVLACRHDAPIEEPPVFRARVIDAGAESTPAIVVDREVTSRIVDAKRDAKAGTTIVTIAGGANEGIRPDWIGTIVDDAGVVLGAFTVIEIKPRTTIGASALDPKQLGGKRVRLATPPRE